MTLPPLTVTTREVDRGSPLAPRDHVVGAPSCWVSQGEGFIAWGEAVRLPVGTGPGRFERGARALAELDARSTVDDPVGLAGSGLIAIGSFAFDAEQDGSSLIVPRLVHGRRDGHDFVTRIDPEGAAPFPPPSEAAVTEDPPARPRFAGSSRPDHEWLAAVDLAVHRVRRGELDKVVLARDHLLWSERPFDVGATVARLLRRFPTCHTFHVEGLVGSTPELLLARAGGRISSRVLAGTAARGRTEDEDAAIGAGLLASEKDSVEHALAVTSVTEVLAPHCSSLTLDGPRLLRLDNVQHLATDVTGELTDPRRSTLELLAALHPTAAVGGSPRAAALAAIAELEGMDRGRYAGPVGWTDAAGDGEWGIALRCAELTRDRARLFAGAGIVAASVPEEELAETRLKLAAMRGVLGDPDA
ncbi:MAG: hypothetical protein RLZZ272_1155 [Actinomycetota bacterium]|jgi:menaquinone-specific isochorismate synthase